MRPSFSIYDASAGSGKTYTLVKEYLTILLSAQQDDAYRSILAITFTNKAVHEMKSRVVNTLAAFASEQVPEKYAGMLRDIANEILLTEQQIKKKSRNIIRHIIHNYAAFDISTIDKFTHRVVRTFAHDLEIPVTFEVSLDTDNLLQEAVDAVIAQAGEDEQLTKLLVDFAIEKTDDDKSWDISRELLETGKLLLNENNKDEIVHFQNNSIAHFMRTKEKVRIACQNLQKQCVEIAQNALQIIADADIKLESFYSKYVPIFLNKIVGGSLSANNNLAEKYLNGVKATRYSGKVVQSERIKIDHIADEIASKILEINNLICKILFYKAFLKNITPLSLVNTLGKQLDKIQQEQNILSITEFNRLINEQIKQQPAPFIYERLGDRYRHFFIDEFQDTSALQWENLIPLIDNATSSETDGQKGTAMIVGDPKQAIYRWRGGKAEQFIELINGPSPFNNKEKSLTRLETNHRSFSEVIQFNNDFFKKISEAFKHPDYEALYLNKSSQNTTDKKGGFVNISFISPDEMPESKAEKNEIYIKHIVKTIEELVKNGFSYSEIAILTRTRAQGVLVAAALIERKIQIISSETLEIANASEVIFILNMLRFLSNPQDIQSKASALQFLAVQKQNQLPIHDFIEAGIAAHNSADFDMWLQHQGFLFSCESAIKKGLYEIVQGIIAAFIPEKNNAYIQFFEDIVLERDMKTGSGISDFLDYWERKGHMSSITTPEGENAIRIMTVHKAKGLEFPVVILPFAEDDFNRKPKEKLWLEHEDSLIELPKILVDNTAVVEQFGTSSATLYQSKRQEVLLDTINVLYVALTRPVEQLYVISAMNLTDDNEPVKDNVSSFFINFLLHKKVFKTTVFSYDFGSPERVSQSGHPVLSAKTIRGVKSVMPPIAVARKESSMWGSKQEKAIEYGNLIHEVMSRVKYGNQIDQTVQEAIELGIISSNQKDTVTATINEIVNHVELACFFSETASILNEQPIITPNGIIKPDRLCLDADSAFILDYKTGTQLPGHFSQIEQYAKALENMGFLVVKKTLVYLGAKVNVVHL